VVGVEDDAQHGLGRQRRRILEVSLDEGFEGGS